MTAKIIQPSCAGPLPGSAAGRRFSLELTNITKNARNTRKIHGKYTFRNTFDRFYNTNIK